MVAIVEPTWGTQAELELELDQIWPRLSKFTAIRRTCTSKALPAGYSNCEIT